MTTTPPLPSWPERPPIYHEPGELDEEKGDPSCNVCHEYERERADAAMARLRVAVEALRSVDIEDSFERIFQLTNSALALIGDLPPAELSAAASAASSAEQQPGRGSS